MEITLGTYRHYTGGLYKVIAIGHRVVGEGKEEKVLEEVVVYHALFNSKDYGENHFWVRSIDNFIENVDIDGKLVPRFSFVAEK